MAAAEPPKKGAAPSVEIANDADAQSNNNDEDDRVMKDVVPPPRYVN